MERENMSNITKIAITGGIGAGKSSMCQILKQQGGFSVISADEQAAKALIEGSPAYSKIRQLFPENPDLDSKQIAEKIFSQPSLKKDFEKIIHAHIFECIKEEERQLIQKGHTVIFYEMPLLFETNMSYYFNYIILVICSHNLKIERVKKRMNISEEQILKRISTQAQHDENKAHFVIENSKSLKDLEESTKNILQKLQLRKGSYCSF